MAKHYQRKDGRYAAKITINGKQKFLYAESQKELDKKITDYKYEFERGMIINSQDMTFKELAERWFMSKQKRKEYNTQIAIQRKLKNHIYPALGQMKVKHIKSYNIQDLINDLVDKGFTDTTTKVFQHVKSILQFGVDNDILIKNVATTVEMPKFKSKPKQSLTKQEREIIEEVAKNHKHGDMIMTFLYTGMRRQEIIALSKKEVHLEDRYFLISDAMYFRNNQATLKGTKNGDTKKIPILDKIYRIIESRYNSTPSKYLFPMYNGNMMSETSFREAMDNFKKACNEYTDTNNLPRIEFTAHTLRHTFCSMLYYAGVPLKEAQQIMGHRSAKVTLDIYTHLDQEMESNVSTKLNDFLTTF